MRKKEEQEEDEERRTSTHTPACATLTISPPQLILGGGGGGGGERGDSWDNNGGRRAHRRNTSICRRRQGPGLESRTQHCLSVCLCRLLSLSGPSFQGGGVKSAFRGNKQEELVCNQYCASLIEEKVISVPIVTSSRISSPHPITNS